MQCVGANWHSSTPNLQRKNGGGISNSQSRIAISRPQTLENGDRLEADEASPSSRFFPPPHVESITSTSNPFVKHCVKLRQSSSYRRSHGSALVVGSTPISEICQFDELNSERSELLECLLVIEELDVVVVPSRKISVSSAVMRKLSGVQSAESIDAAALMRIPSSFVQLSGSEVVEAGCRRWFPSCHRILVLEGIQDPGNLGTLLRSAMAFGWEEELSGNFSQHHFYETTSVQPLPYLGVVEAVSRLVRGMSGVFLLDGCCDPFNEKAIRASRGASFQLPIVCGNWAHLEALGRNRRMKMLGAHPHSTDSHKPSTTLSQSLAASLSEHPVCLVLGSEGGGLSSKARGSCELVNIPMAGRFESLNVAVAGGIFLHMLQSDGRR